VYFNLSLDFIDLSKIILGFTRGLGYLGCALISTQKIYLFLGDLARYREQINSPKQNNYGKAKQYYVKAQQIIPRNGRPYNQLALLSVYSVSFSPVGI
jgi:protein SMG6